MTDPKPEAGSQQPRSDLSSKAKPPAAAATASPEVEPVLPRGDDPLIGFVIQKMENGYQATEEMVREKFNWSLGTLLDVTGYEHRAYTTLEDADMIYQLGGWNSPEEHYNIVHEMPVFQDFLDEFGGVLDTKASYHTTISYKTLSWNAPHLTFVRCWVPPSRKATFEAALAKWIPYIEEKLGGVKASHGWRVEGGWKDQYHVDDMATFDPALVGRFRDETEKADEWDVLLPFQTEDTWKAPVDIKAHSILENLVGIEVKRFVLMDTKFDDDDEFRKEDAHEAA